MAYDLVSKLEGHGYLKPEEQIFNPPMQEIKTKKFKHIFIRHMPAHSVWGDSIAMVVFDDPTENKGFMYSIDYDEFAEYCQAGLTPIVAEECYLQLQGKEFRKRFT